MAPATTPNMMASSTKNVLWLTTGCVPSAVSVGGRIEDGTVDGADAEGSSEGEVVGQFSQWGATVGVGCDDSLGSLDGSVEGSVEGSSDGASVGVAVGVCDGSGVAVGVSLGCGESDSLGVALGSSLGCALGEALGWVDGSPPQWSSFPSGLFPWASQSCPLLGCGSGRHVD
jgi:hypothetical protein